MSFPQDFTWGVATASYQIEGAAHEDGRGDSVWDMLCRKPNAIWRGQNGDVACDHYHRYHDDIAIMRDLGVQAYRLSIAWPRIFPSGTGAVNQKGIDFYNRLIDALLEAGIEPYVTLFHWDYPTALYRRGGWLNPDSPDWFADYTRVVVEALSDRVKNWMTLNEPQCFIGLGLHSGDHAPGDKLEFRQVVYAIHHTLLAHGKSVQAIRACTKQPCRIGFAPVGQVSIPATENPADVEAARRGMFSTGVKTVWSNALWMDPVFLGRYPEDVFHAFSEDMCPIHDGDMDTIAQPIDFFGTNIYQGGYVRAGENGEPEVVPPALGEPLTAFRWPVTPAALYWGPKFFYERYKKPIIMTENGMSSADWESVDGKVHDPQRIDFLTRYLREFARAGRDGVDIRGYFQWSLLDNFEWAQGYKERFGLVFVDYPTGRRIPKDSAYWYREVIQSNGAILDAAQ